MIWGENPLFLQTSISLFFVRMVHGRFGGPTRSSRHRRDIETCSWITDEESLFRVGGHLSFRKVVIVGVCGGTKNVFELYELLPSIYKSYVCQVWLVKCFSDVRGFKPRFFEMPPGKQSVTLKICFTKMFADLQFWRLQLKELFGISVFRGSPSGFTISLLGCLKDWLISIASQLALFCWNNISPTSPIRWEHVCTWRCEDVSCGMFFCWRYCQHDIQH